jgi:hypothetical protein
MTFIITFLAAIVVIFGASFKAQQMLIYNQGDSYTCAHNFDTLKQLSYLASMPNSSNSLSDAQR